MRAWELKEQREKGSSLTDSGYEYKYANIYRAVLSDVNTFNPMDYVTRSIKFAKEHADHIAAVEGKPAHVIKAMVEAKNVYDAYNPGEYFYDGPIITKTKIVYRKEPEMFENKAINLTTHDKLWVNPKKKQMKL